MNKGTIALLTENNITYLGFVDYPHYKILLKNGIVNIPMEQLHGIGHSDIGIILFTKYGVYRRETNGNGNSNSK